MWLKGQRIGAVDGERMASKIRPLLLSDRRESSSGSIRGALFLRGLAGFARVDEVAKLFGWFEVRHAFGGDLNTLASFRVAANAGIALANAEGAESADLDFVTALQC
jgi:hypothetical protein